MLRPLSSKHKTDWRAWCSLIAMVISEQLWRPEITQVHEAVMYERLPPLMVLLVNRWHKTVNLSNLCTRRRKLKKQIMRRLVLSLPWKRISCSTRFRVALKLNRNQWQLSLASAVKLWKTRLSEKTKSRLGPKLLAKCRRTRRLALFLCLRRWSAAKQLSQSTATVVVFTKEASRVDTPQLWRSSNWIRWATRTPVSHGRRATRASTSTKRL